MKLCYTTVISADSPLEQLNLVANTQTQELVRSSRAHSFLLFPRDTILTGKSIATLAASNSICQIVNACNNGNRKDANLPTFVVALFSGITFTIRVVL
jgi:hypothetical protein